MHVALRLVYIARRHPIGWAYSGRAINRVKVNQHAPLVLLFATLPGYWSAALLCPTLTYYGNTACDDTAHALGVDPN